MANDDASKSNDGLCDVNNKLQNMRMDDNNNRVSVCANCGKEGANNICNKCNVVKYCNAVCKKVHKKKHKKDCEEHIRLAADRAAKLHDIELFKQPPPSEDCPICFVQLPIVDTGWRYQTCCGKVICCGCVHAPKYDHQGNKVDIIKQNECAFCRVVAPHTMGEAIERYERRMQANDAIAIYNVGVYYRNGVYGYPQDYAKALEFYHRAGELGFAEAYHNIGNRYHNGDGVDVDKKKASHYYELAAMKGNARARHNLGSDEGLNGNIHRALKHYMIAVRSGYSESLDVIKELYSDGLATKDDYMKALQLYQAYLSEIKSPQRDKAAAFAEEYRYY